MICMKSPVATGADERLHEREARLTGQRQALEAALTSLGVPGRTLIELEKDINKLGLSSYTPLRYSLEFEQDECAHNNGCQTVIVPQYDL